jgi:hypothetical protein
VGVFDEPKAGATAYLIGHAGMHVGFLPFEDTKNKTRRRKEQPALHYYSITQHHPVISTPNSFSFLFFFSLFYLSFFCSLFSPK